MDGELAAGWGRGRAVEWAAHARACLSARSDSAITSLHMAAAIALDSPRVAGEPCGVSAGAEIEANSAAKVGAR